MRILVVGGSGFIGQHVVGKLVAQGDTVFVPTRRLPHARELFVYPTVTVLPGDIFDTATLNDWVRDIDAVVNLVGVLHSKSGEPFGPDFARAHVELPKRLAQACVDNGVPRLVHISALGASETGSSQYLRSKAAGEQAIAAIAAANPSFCTTIFRPSVVFGPRDKFMNMFAGLAKVFPFLPMAGSHAKMQPVYVGDVAQAVINVLMSQKFCGATLDLAGPNVYTLGELVKLASQWSGRPRPVVDLPMSLGRLQARFFECLPGDPLMSRDNLDSLKTDNVSSEPMDPALGIVPTALETIAPSYLRDPS
ncbi:MAG: complex I NDUFA9 subunit family protein [Orrella sp.]